MEPHSSDLAVAEARELSRAYLEGRMNPIEAAVALEGFREVLATVPSEVFDTFNLVSSETDAIPVGERRTLWHPDVRAAEDAKHDRAQEWARPLMDEACSSLVAALPYPKKDGGYDGDHS